MKNKSDEKLDEKYARNSFDGRAEKERVEDEKKIVKIHKIFAALPGFGIFLDIV